MYKRILFLFSLFSIVQSAIVQNPLPTIRILFVGNSLTIRNDLPGMVKGMILKKGLNKGQTLSVTDISKPSASFSEFANSKESLRLISSPNAWTHVIFQEQSEKLSLGLPFEKIYTWPFARTLVSQVEKPVKIIWYQTMAHSGGSRINDSYALMQDRIITGYSNLNEMITQNFPDKTTDICPVGQVWKRAVKNGFIKRLYIDSVHPSKIGTYLVALTFYRTITGRDAQTIGFSYLPKGVPRSFVKKAQMYVDIEFVKQIPN
jgi:hypothetical protein